MKITSVGEWLPTVWEGRQWIEGRSFDVAMPEHSHAAHAWKGSIASSYPEPENGVFALPGAPGLGVEIDIA